jgi:peroxiredoxin
MLNVGDKAPDFTLLDQDGNGLSLSESLKANKVRHLIYFYPKADTPGTRLRAAVAVQVPLDVQWPYTTGGSDPDACDRVTAAEPTP